MEVEKRKGRRRKRRKEEDKVAVEKSKKGNEQEEEEKKRTGGRKQRKMEMTKIRERGRECKGRGYSEEMKSTNFFWTCSTLPTFLSTHNTADFSSMCSRSLSVCRLRTGCGYKCEVATS